MSGDIPDQQEDTITNIDEETTEPPSYRVLLHNDDYTTKAFVVEILLSIFNKSLEQATRLMWYVHHNGVGVCGVYPFEVAAGMDVVEVRKAFPKLAIAGGIDKRALFEGREAIDRELENRVSPILEQGRFIPTVDHMVSMDVSFDNFRYYREKLDQMLKKHSKSWDRD